MLDDMKKIHERDSRDMLGAAGKQAEQVLYDYAFRWTASTSVTNVVLIGDSSAELAAKTYQVVPGALVPFEIMSGSTLPAYMSEQTLLICCSYDGDNQAVVDIVQQALSIEVSAGRPMAIIVTAGGALLQLAQDAGLPCIVLPRNFLPNQTFGFQYRALAEIFEQAHLSSSFLSTLEASIGSFAQAVATWGPTIATKHNRAKQIALECMGRSVVIASGPELFPACLRWKMSLNGYAKQIAWCNRLSPGDTTELEGWSGHPEQKPYAIVELRSDIESEFIQRQFTHSERFLSGKRPGSMQVQAEGSTILGQILWSGALGEYVGLYAGLLHGTDPSSHPIVERIQKLTEE